MAKLRRSWDKLDEEAEREGQADIIYRQSKKQGVGRGYKLVDSQRMQEAGGMKHDRIIANRHVVKKPTKVYKGKVNLNSW